MSDLGLHSADCWRQPGHLACAIEKADAIYAEKLTSGSWQIQIIPADTAERSGWFEAATYPEALRLAIEGST